MALRFSYCVVIVCFALFVQHITAAEIAEQWGQCGGTSCQSGNCKDAPWPDAKCPQGWRCKRQTAFYWQCDNKAGKVIMAYHVQASFSKLKGAAGAQFAAAEVERFC
jgi:hypothetical protein